MKYCSHCGAQIDDNAKFCTKCGSSTANNQNQNANQSYNPNYNQNYNPNYNPNYNSNFNSGYGQRPVYQLKTNRGLIKYILLSLITFGIYGLVVMSGVSTDINTVASKYDGKKTMHFCLVYFIFSWLTCGIVPIVWAHRISARIGRELNRRGIGFSFGAEDFWLWDVLGSFIVVGPFIYYHKLFKSMNLLCEDYNIRG